VVSFKLLKGNLIKFFTELEADAAILYNHFVVSKKILRIIKKPFLYNFLMLQKNFKKSLKFKKSLTVFNNIVADVRIEVDVKALWECLFYSILVFWF
jgi:hypothetical protein